MTRRAPRAELEFGNDSFLDVICNIVGVLIILILVCGDHISKAPVTAEMLASIPIPGSTHEVKPSVPTPAAKPKVSKPVIEEPPAPVAPPPDIPLSPELVRQRDRLQAELASLGASRQAAESQLTELSDVGRAAGDRISAISSAVSAERAQAGKRREQVEILTANVAKAKQIQRSLENDVKLAEREKSPVKPIKHRMTPMSREVTGKEVHFRLLNDRVALVPVDELAQRLKPQIERQKDFLMKYRRQEGQVGPVGGFSMKYAVERDSMMAMDEFRGGRGTVRISVTRWEIVPEPELQTETAEQALKRGSAFIGALKAADVDATLTFWVYPDSFKIFRRLRDFAYEEGFTVAARPLPQGVPICGSPNGSRSAGQ
jgi:uncharacterized small protein (DUF1192 family)